jgi:hypothetical protein
MPQDLPDVLTEFNPTTDSSADLITNISFNPIANFSTD